MTKSMREGYFYHVSCSVRKHENGLVGECESYVNVGVHRHSSEQRRAVVDTLKKKDWMYLSKTKEFICPDCRNVSVEPEAPEKLEPKTKELAGV